MAIGLLVILVGVIVIGAAAGFFLPKGLLRNRPRDRRRDPNAQTLCGATPPHRAAPAHPETKSKRRKKRKRKGKAGAEDDEYELGLLRDRINKLERRLRHPVDIIDEREEHLRRDLNNELGLLRDRVNELERRQLGPSHNEMDRIRDLENRCRKLRRR